MTGHLPLEERLSRSFGFPMTTSERAVVDDRVSTTLDSAAQSSPRPDRRRAIAAAIVAATMLLGIVAITVVSGGGDEARLGEERVLADDALAGAFADTCLSRSEAIEVIRERLDAAGLVEWSIRTTDATAKAACVAGALGPSPKEIMLVPTMGGPLARAVENARTEMRSACYDRGAAVAMVQAILDANWQGDRPIEVRGIETLPNDGAEEYVAHIQAGCYVYETSQTDAQGLRTFYIAGP